MRGDGVRRLAASLSVAVLAAGAAAVPGTAASAAAAEPPAPYSCPADPDAAITAALGPGHSVSGFLDAWTPRLQGTVPVAGATLDDFLNRDSLPAEIADEGYHSLPEDLQGCLTRRLFDRLDTLDPSFPHPALSQDAALGLLYGFVFDNAWVEAFRDSTAPGDPTVVDNPVPVDPVDALLDSLRTPPLPGIPAVPVPPQLDPVPLVTKTVEELQAGLLHPVDLLFADPGLPVPQLELPVELPPIGLPALDLAAVLNRLRGVADSATYRVCWSVRQPSGGTFEQAESAGGVVTVETAVQLRLPGPTTGTETGTQCSVDVPLGTPVPVHLAGDRRPDVTAQLTPLVDPANPVNTAQMRWVLNRLPDSATGYSGPLEAHVFALFTLPTADVQLSVGSDGFPSTLARRSEYVFTLTDLQKAVAGEVVVDVDAHHVAPGPSSGITYSVAPVHRDADSLGAGTTETFDAGDLVLTPVPASDPLVLDNAVEATLTVGTGNLDGDDPPTVDEHLGVALRMPQPNVVLDATLLSKLPPAEGAECCPFRDVQARVDAIPTEVDLAVDSFPSRRHTQVAYVADASIDEVHVRSTSYADTDGDSPTGADLHTFNRVTATVTDVPKEVQASFTTPDAASAAKTTVVDYAASAPEDARPRPRVEVQSEDWAHDAAASAASLQRRLLFRAGAVPTRVHLANTTTAVTERNSTGRLEFEADDRVTDVHLEVADQIGVSELEADLASLPKAFAATYDVEGAADLDPGTAGCEDPGHTVIHVDGRTALADPPGSSPFGELTARYRSRVDAFLVPDPAIAPLQHAVVNADPRSAATCLDDTVQADLRYGGLRSLDASLLESGAVTATLRNDVEQAFVLQASKPDELLTADVRDVPRQVSFAKQPVSPGRTRITYDGCTPTGTTCTPRTIDGLAVRLDGRGTGGTLEAGEFVDATATTVPAHVELDLDLPDADGAEKTVAFRASGPTDVTAAVRKGVTDLGDLSIAADVRGVPQAFDVSFGKGHPVSFTSGAGGAVGEIRAAVTNTGTARAPAEFAPHAYARYVETPGAAPQLEATLGLANLRSFLVAPGAGGGAFSGSVTTDVPAGPNPNRSFALSADVRTLATLAGGDGPDPDLNRATVIRTGSGGVVLDPLPSHVTIGTSGGVQPGGSDTSTLTVDTTGSAQKPAFSGDVAIGAPDSVADALAETLPSVQGVNVGDGGAAGESGAVRLRLLLPSLPSKAVVRYGQITTQLATRPADPSFDIRGFGPLPGSELDVIVRLDDAQEEADRLSATISLAGLHPALARLQLFPINLRPHPGGDLDLDVLYSASEQAADLDLDLSFGMAEGGRPDQRVKVHTDVVPHQVAFQARLGAAAAPDLAVFHAEFLDAAGQRTGSPGRTTFRYQTPAADRQDNPPAKVTLDLRDVPSLLDFAVKEAASTKTGNPNETCGLVESAFVLPTLAYDAEGAHRDDLDVAGEIDLSFIKPGSPTVVFDLVDLADGFTVSNTDEGGTYNLENPGGTTTKVLVKVLPLDVTLLHINWTRCPEPTGVIGWKSSGQARVGVATQLRLQVDALQDVELKPGFSTGVRGAYGRLTLGLPSPSFQAHFSDGFSSGLFIRLSDRIKGTIPVLQAPNSTVEFPLPIVFHVARSEPGEWFDFNTHIPCVVPGFELVVQANIEPHRVRLERNQFTADGGTVVATADPFGASAGLSVLFGGVDIIDSIAGLFTSPYDHGIRAPSLDCEFFL